MVLRPLYFLSTVFAFDFAHESRAVSSHSIAFTLSAQSLLSTLKRCVPRNPTMTSTSSQTASPTSSQSPCVGGMDSRPDHGYNNSVATPK
jgi:hypothetical protein